MKKTILFLSILAIGLSAEEPYLLSEEVIIKKGVGLSSDTTYQDWCIDRQVWREYDRYRRGSLSQIMYSKDGVSSIPLACSLYNGWKDNIERLNRVDGRFGQ